ncbi:kinase-like domain-containing protein [Lophiotrema nucula]|uniref:Kinase-like domain-containing protein n=1 Tax=Lophiotrema nucula TaxID=690887 RepID=A0A6A5ZUP2_9PLEO|nr:kinase-like domain-containing protein [Lophiotrema nucula]
MPEPQVLRKWLQSKKREAAGQTLRQFLPNAHPSFQIDTHKHENTAEIVFHEGIKVFTILVEMHLEHALASFIENDILDRALPVKEENLDNVLEVDEAQRFARLQWDYLAYSITKGTYQRKLAPERILPYLEQVGLGGGGYSSVYKVLIHPAHQNIRSGTTEKGLCLVRKEIRYFNAGVTRKDESELLFLLGSLKHPNIVELLAAYMQDGVPNLLFEPADMDLDQFLRNENRIPAFEDNATVYKAAYGLSSGLRYLHFFQPRPRRASGDPNPLMHGLHQDIKPRNILVRGKEFILADFGLSRLKPDGDDSKTVWKDATFEYGAPECRDPITLAQRKIGRASDIWSLGCIFSEIMIYLQAGHRGVSEFRGNRLVDGVYGKTRCFHDGTRLLPQILPSLAPSSKDSYTEAASHWSKLMELMFKQEADTRPNSKTVESSMAVVVLKALLGILITTFETCGSILSQKAGNNIFNTKLKLEKDCLQAWAWVLGLVTLHGTTQVSSQNILTTFQANFDALNSAVQNSTTSYDFSDSSDNRDFIVSVLHQCNDTLYSHLSEGDKISADGMFKVLSTLNMLPCNPASSADGVSPLMGSRYDEPTTVAAMRYMSLLYSRHPGSISASPKLDRSLIEEDPHSLEKDGHDLDIRPQIHWYRYGYRDEERKEVLIEWKHYGIMWMKSTDSEEFEQNGEIMFDRVQELVTLLRQSKPKQFRVLECLGAFHHPGHHQFGLVYSFPDNESTPIRLDYLLKGGRSSRPRPHMGQKLALARALTASVQSLHISGWLHKDINAYNILFFTPSRSKGDVDYAKPYLVGFQQSRQDAYIDGPDPKGKPTPYTEGPDPNQRLPQYQHPIYRAGNTSFRREFDYYSLGLVLLEIGTWESLSQVFNKFPTATSSELRALYVNICDKQILERMGPTYHEATTACLQSDTQLVGEEGRVSVLVTEHWGVWFLDGQLLILSTKA